MSRHAGSMKCKACGSMQTEVIDSRGNVGGTSIRRRRKCLDCGERFTTYECRDHPTTAVRDLQHIQREFERMLEVLRIDIAERVTAATVKAAADLVEGRR